jgi:nucleotide sugar dehydrogenase
MRVSIVGTGKVGIAYAVFLASKGHTVVAIDKNQAYIQSLKDGSFKTTEPGVKEGLHKVYKYTTVDDGESDICIVLVDTPTCYAGYEHTNLERVLEDVTKRHETVIVSCTTQPGFMKQWPGVFYNPLFIQLGNQITHQETTKNVLIGGDPNQRLDTFFKQNHGDDVRLHYMSQTAAEVAKLSLNCIITTKISFANMIDEALWRSGHGDEADKVLGFVGADPRIGDKCLKPGWGYGGPCFPRDNRALCTFLREWGASDYIPIATHETNERHAVVMAMKKNVEDSEFEDLNYKPGCPVYCDEESHKNKTKQIRKLNFIRRI